MRYYYMTILCLAWASWSLSSGEYFRTERQVNGIPLVYPYGATYKLLIGCATPVSNKEEINLIFITNFQYQYLQFQNISALSRYYFIKEVSRESQIEKIRRDLDGREDERLVFYKSAADMMTAKGMNGPQCVLRAICEAAQFPVQEEGLVGEILHLLLTPDFGKSAFDEEDPGEELSVYTDAAVAGRQMFSCPAVYNGCPDGEGLLELFSTLSND